MYDGLNPDFVFKYDRYGYGVKLQYFSTFLMPGWYETWSDMTGPCHTEPVSADKALEHAVAGKNLSWSLNPVVQEIYD